jgi:hypothetical protein
MDEPLNGFDVEGLPDGDPLLVQCAKMNLAMVEHLERERAKDDEEGL